MTNRIHRVTVFKLPKPEDVDVMIEQYKILEKTNRKNGNLKNDEPYIRAIVVGKAKVDPRAQDYTLVAKTEFASLDDMEYFDKECPAHQKLKSVAQSLTLEGIMSVYFEPSIVASISH